MLIFPPSTSHHPSVGPMLEVSKADRARSITSKMLPLFVVLLRMRVRGDLWCVARHVIAKRGLIVVRLGRWAGLAEASTRDVTRSSHMLRDAEV
jgi:hypothetical protein